MAFPGNATALAVKSIYYPSSLPCSGPGFHAKTSIRQGYDKDFVIWYYPVLRLFKVERYRNDGECKTLLASGWVPESKLEWFELVE
jgi:hypothetical protein